MKLVNRKTRLILRLGITAMALLIGQQAMAVGTRAATQIDNTATVDYDVLTIAQTQLSSNTVSFVVDRRVNFTLSVVGGALVPVTPGGSFPAVDYWVDFLLTNTTNSVIDFNVALAQMVGGLVRPGQTDDTDMAAVEYAVSANSVANGDTDPARSGPQYVDELEADDSIRIRVFGDAALAMINGQIAGVDLTVNGAEGGTGGSEGAPLVDGVLNGDLTVENVFADAGIGNSESAQDGFIAVSAQLTVTKTYSVFAGDLGSGLPIPGATIEYIVTIVNSSTTTAADPVQIGDVLDVSVALVLGDFAGSTDFEIDNGGTVSQCTAAADADDCVEAGGTITIGGGGTISLAASTTLTLTFHVLILDPAPTP